MKKAIIYSQALRYRRIIDDDAVLRTELEKLKKKFTSRGYPHRLVDTEIARIYNINRLDALNINQKKKNVASS